MNWVCECGIVNPFDERECGQCGQRKADCWAEADRATLVAVRVLDVGGRKPKHEPRGVFRDECYQLEPGFTFRNQKLASICHRPFVTGGNQNN